MATFKPYQLRSTRFHGYWEHGAWRLKIYLISENENLQDDAYTAIAKSLAESEIDRINTRDSHHKAGFLTIHIAGMFNQIIFDYWARENELRHLVYKANAETPTEFRNITCTGEAFCVWELRVIAHERDAWIRHILENNASPDFEGYFGDVLNEPSQ